jgi:hypothetical protein
MQKGLIKKFSIGYSVAKKSFEGGKRMLEELKLVEVSPVTFPMNPEANLLTVKSDGKYDVRQFEKMLRDVGHLSQREAKAFIAEGFKGLQRDVVNVSEEKQEADTFWSMINTTLSKDK